MERPPEAGGERITTAHADRAIGHSQRLQSGLRAGNVRCTMKRNKKRKKKKKRRKERERER